jgi:DNA transformation protein and related proteins
MHTSGFVDYVLDLLSPFGNVRSRKMFGGYGIYKDNIFFALIVNDALYFKISENDRSIYESFGSQPLSFTKKNGQVITMSYWQVPVDILEDQNKFTPLAQRAFSAAIQSKSRKSK